MNGDLGGQWNKKDFVIFNSTDTELKPSFNSNHLAVFVTSRQLKISNEKLGAGTFHQFIKTPFGKADVSDSAIFIPLHQLIVIELLPFWSYKLRFEIVAKNSPFNLTIWEPIMPLYSNNAAASTSNLIANTVAVDNTKSVILSAADSAKLGRTIINKSSSVLYVNLKDAASLSSYIVKLTTNVAYEVPFGFTGDVTGIWDKADANGSAKVYEFS